MCIVIIILGINRHIVNESINNSKGNINDEWLRLTLITYYDIKAFILAIGNSVEISILNIMLLIEIEIYWRKEKIGDE